MRLFTLYLSIITIIIFQSCGPNLPEDVEFASEQLPDKLDYNLHVKPILSDRCFACHGPDKGKLEAGLRLDLAETAFDELPESPGKHAIVPGNAEKSELFHRILDSDPDVVMPPAESNLTLSAYEKAVLTRWIEEGAEYREHWAFEKPRKFSPPKVKQKDWIKSPIDAFTLAKIEQNGWQPAEEADKEMLLRRVSFDLTGLPPTVEEIDEFLADESPDAYEKVVDRLLESSHFGERMAVDWLDLARFADTHGYTVDRYRDMSPWRDWVIKAFNQNMPYDQFVTWQLAGDMLPNAQKDQILATGFNRNHQQNMEGGIVPEEFRVEYVADRTNTLGTAFLGLTVECARCHDHKYDPISQKNYFQLFSFFNNVKEAGQISWDNATPVPTMLLTKEETEKQLHFLENQINEKVAQIEELKQQEEGAFAQWLENGRFRERLQRNLPLGATAHFELNRLPIKNKLNSSQKGEMKQQHTKEVETVLTDGKNGKGLLLNGDAWLDLGRVGVFDRSMPFSVGIWVNLPEELENGVIFHKGDGAVLYNFRGFHLALKDNKLEAILAHTLPYNAIVEYGESVPRNEWIHLTMTYDGSSKASGLKVYLNGKELETEIENDHLYKDITFGRGKGEPGIQIGARWRGMGVRGAKVDDITVFDRELSAIEVAGLHDPSSFSQILQVPANQFTEGVQESLKAFYLATRSSGMKNELGNLQALRSKLNSTVDTVREIMVIDEMEEMRPAFVLDRGQYDAHGERVFPGTPESILPMTEDLPQNRLGLVKWLFHEDQPLTARVTVNRLWQLLFGQGLVKTTEDFGSQGQLPSHPALLDYLAASFQESGWDVKALMKQMVMSATYRQASRNTPEIHEADPENILLARGPSARLTAEMMRDNALAASGLLNKSIGGPSVKPYQPADLWRVNGGRYVRDSAQKLYRRGLYSFWKRSVPLPTQATFDAPTRSSCTVRRQKTSTPLQALILLNDPTFLEAAKAIGVKIADNTNIKQGIELAFRSLSGRRPSSEELNLLMELREVELAKFKENPEKIDGWLDIGEYQPELEQKLASLAANMVVASTILNADATVVKR